MSNMLKPLKIIFLLKIMYNYTLVDKKLYYASKREKIQKK